MSTAIRIQLFKRRIDVPSQGDSLSSSAARASATLCIQSYRGCSAGEYASFNRCSMIRRI